MARVAPAVPDETSILCESCGYTLDGLPPGSNCPECGKPAADSTSGDGRRLPAWEDQAHGSRLARFITTSLHVILRPSQFYRSFVTRSDGKGAARFADIHWIIASILFTAAARAHWNWYERDIAAGDFLRLDGAGGLFILCYLALWGTTRLAARLTAWEARYRGIRLPRPAVLRGLYYHSAHYLPVALIAFMTTFGHELLRRRAIIGYQWATTYLWILSTQVILAAVYLFWTYWAAMRNMMYANR